ncbi:MAG: IS701 family transposase [Actinomycetota bacterium]|jgi:SRSO17 transposase|nr:IS701 family transposase [Actinomycetota bacterium]MDQ3378604.1 IS701 family transposase [Actinomycetota bacterium]
MTARLPVEPAPGPLEGYAARFDDLFRARAQREGFRRYLEGLLLPAERNKTLTALANTEPVAGAQRREAQSLQWFLSESGWDPKEVNERRLELLVEDPATAPEEGGVLVIDEHGDRKWGKHTAHVGKQWLGNIGKTENGVVSVSSLLADEGVYFPLEVEPYTPAHHFEGGKNDPRFRTKLKIASELVELAMEKEVPFRAVVADSFYGEDREFKRSLGELGVGYVLALKKSHCWWHLEGTVGALWQAAEAAGWRDAEEPGDWTKVERAFRDGHREEWWALEVEAGPYGKGRAKRALVVTPDPETLPGLATWYLTTNLPAPGCARETEEALAAASVAEVVRLYGLRMWVEQSYKQVKHALGWSAYQVRSNPAIRRHWQLACCAFSFCWWAYGRLPASLDEPTEEPPEGDLRVGSSGRGKGEASGVLAGGVKSGEGVAGTVGDAVALLEGVLRQAPATGATSSA